MELSQSQWDDLTAQPNMFVKKIVSLNPDRHDLVPLHIAISKYADYARSFEVAYRSPKLDAVARVKMHFKTFDIWLETEI